MININGILLTLLLILGTSAVFVGVVFATLWSRQRTDNDLLATKLSALEATYADFQSHVSRFADLNAFYQIWGHNTDARFVREINSPNAVDGQLAGHCPNYAYSNKNIFGITQTVAQATNSLEQSALIKVLKQPSVPLKCGDWVIMDETSATAFAWNPGSGTWDRSDLPHDRTIPVAQQIGRDYQSARVFLRQQQSNTGVDPNDYTPLWF